MDGEEELRSKIVLLLSNAFVVRKTVRPDEVARELAKTVDLPIEELAERVSVVAKGLGIGTARK